MVAALGFRGAANRACSSLSEVRAAPRDEEIEHDVEALGAKDAEVLSEVTAVAELERQYLERHGGTHAGSEVSCGDVQQHAGIVRRTREKIDPANVSAVTPAEEAAIAFQKYAHNRRQEGPFVGSELRHVPKEVVEFRKRREIERVMPFEDPYIANETSFRRLPEGARLPNEAELRALYPQNTTMKYELCEAPCVDSDARGVDLPPQPIYYCRWVPENYDPSKTYCTFVVLPDQKGLPVDFDDMCANFWQRPAFMKGLLENNVVLLAPVINVKQVPAAMEHVVIRFIDWVTANFKCENGKPHLIGKGNGAVMALRVGITAADVVHSIIAICGKLNSPLKSDDRVREMLPKLNGTHVLMYIPGAMFKPSNIMRLKGLCDFMKVRPAVRAIHYEMVRDLQVYYAINPIEFWNYVLFFRQYHSTAVAESGRFFYRETEWFMPSGRQETVNADSTRGETANRWN